MVDVRHLRRPATKPLALRQLVTCKILKTVEHLGRVNLALMDHPFAPGALGRGQLEEISFIPKLLETHRRKPLVDFFYIDESFHGFSMPEGHDRTQIRAIRETADGR